MTSTISPTSPEVPQETPTAPALCTVRQFAERYPVFSEGSLRWLIFQQDRPDRDQHYPDLSAAVIRVGRRLLINEREFFRALEAHQRQRR